MDRPDQAGSPDEIRRNLIRESAILDELHRRRNAVRVPEATGISVADIQAPTSAIRFRPHAVHAERFQRAYRARRHDRPSFPGDAGTIQQAVERLNEASSSLSSLLDQPMPRLNSPDNGTRPYSGETDANRRRAKRRRLDGDPYPMDFKPFSYGYRGQVVPGALKMEIVSCDGGLHADSRHLREYCPENILRNDKSVYCTDSSKCNIIMRHRGETPFCLRKIVIKAPERGFTAPIQEGLIFISMSSRDLLERTAQYHIRETSPRATSPESLNHTGRATTPHIASREPNENRPPSRRTNDAADRTIPPPISDAFADEHSNIPLLSPSQLLRPYISPSSTNAPGYSSPLPRTISPPTPLPFTVTTDCSDHSHDEEEESSAATLADRFRRDHISQVAMDSSSDSTDDGDLSRFVTVRARRGARQRRHGRRAIPSKIEIAAPNAADEIRNASNGTLPIDVLAPHAKFFIERDKNTISIKFEPLVSGRFILLKLWSPAKDQNIDIQSFVAHGFAGSRFFPAAQPM